MIYEMTDEQVEKDKSTQWKVLLFTFLLILGIIALVTGPKLLKGTADLVPVLAIGALVLFLAMAGAMVSLNDGKKKKVFQVETNPKGLVLISQNGRDEIPAMDILKLGIAADTSGEVRTIFLRTRKSPSPILRGFGKMDRLALDLEKMVKDPGLVSRSRGTADPRKKAMGGLLVVAILVGVVGGMLGIYWLLAKLGFGFLLAPLSFISLGAIKFASNRRNRNDRMTGIALVFLGVIWAVVNFISLIMSGGK